MPAPSAGLSARLAELDAAGLRRRRRLLESAQGPRIRLDGHAVISFASNDYLGLANHPAVVAAARAALERDGLGAGASHLLGGHHRRHAEAEAVLAEFVGLPAALLFSSGYMANLGVVTALLGRGDAVFADKLNHASLVDAALLSRAEHQRYRHGDLDHLASLLAASSASTKLIATDAVFSMDGDLAPIPALLELAERHDAWLYVDDAHGFGILGERGRGILTHQGLSSPRVDHPALIYLATLGKAAGVAGAFVAGQTEVVEWLANRARTYVYTTAQPPLLAAATLASLAVIADGAALRQRLADHIGRFRAGAVALPWPLLASTTPIQPVLVGDNATAVRLAEGLFARGFYVPAIRPPTVPVGQARLRVSLSAGHDAHDVEGLLAALAELAEVA